MMPPYMIVSTSGKRVVTAVNIDDLEFQVRAVLDKLEEVEVRLREVMKAKEEAVRQLHEYVKDERP